MKHRNNGAKLIRYSGNKTTHKRMVKLVFLVLPFIFAITGCGMLGIKKDTGIYLPPSTEVQEKLDQLRPGLSVVYFHGFYRNISQMPRGKSAIEKGIPGKPIPVLNHEFGEDMVFDSGRSKGVGMHMDGFILFDKTGDYIFQANTNDGFRLLISGIKIIDDPHYHSDRLSEIGIVRVEEPEWDLLPKRMSRKVKVKVSETGWYPLRILYFQRKGTATIQLFWIQPGDKKKVFVPAEVYAHIAARQ